jgi:hypothetical protein
MANRRANQRVTVIVDEQVFNEEVEVTQTLGILREYEEKGEVTPQDLAESRADLQRSLRNNF